MVAKLTITFNMKISTFRPRSAFMCFFRMSKQRVILSVHSINWLILITELECVYRTVWTGSLNVVQLWCCASPTNISVLQRYQSKTLSLITQAPRYVSNSTLHQDLHIAQVRKVFHEKTLTHRISLSTQPNPLMGPLINQTTTRRLRRRWTFDATQ